MAERALATAFVNIVPGTKDFETKLKSQLAGEMSTAGVTGGEAMAKGTAQGFGSKIKGYVAPIAAGFAASFAAIGVTQFFKDAVNGASDFAEQGAAVEQVFGKASGAIQKFAEGGAVSLGQTKTQILEASKQFGIYGKAAGLAGKDNAAFSTELVKLATDLASFNNTSVDEAIMAIGSGLRGEAEPLRRYGVLLDDATLKAQALKMGLIDSTKEALTPQNKVLAANAVILKQTETQQGDFARTSEGFANQQRILAAQFGNLSISVGQVLLPVLTQLASFANTVLIPAFTATFNFIRDNKDVVLTFVTVLGGLLTAFNAISIATKAWATAQAILNAVMALNPFTIIAIAVAALVAGIVYLAKETTFFQDAWTAMTKWVTEAWHNVTKFLSDSWKTIQRFFGDALKFITNLFLNWTVLGWIIKNWSNIVSFFSGAWDSIIGFFRTALATVANVVTTGISNVIGFFRDLPSKVLGALGNASKWLVEVGRNMIEGLLKGAGSILSTVGDFFLDMLPGWIVGPFKKALGIASPSKVFAGFGKDILRGLQKGLLGGESSITSTMDKVSDWVADKFKSGDLPKKAAKAAKALVKTYTKELGQLQKAYDATLEKLEKAQDELATRLEEKLRFVQDITRDFGAGYVLDEETTAQSAVQGLKDRIAKTKELRSVTDQLIAMGLNEDLYRQIVEAGAVDFARSIIEGGQAAVEELNILADEANAQAQSLAERVGGVLFDQGIQFAESIVQGLEAEESRISNLMERVAETFANKLTNIISSALATPEVEATPKGKKGKEPKKAAKAPKIKKPVFMANGGFVERPTAAIIGEAGPEVVTPLKDFERMVGLDRGASKTIIYNAAPNKSIDSERALFQAMKRAEVIAGW